MYLLFPLSDVVKESGTVPITFLTKVDMTSNQKDSNAKKISLFLLATIFILATALRFFHLDRDLGGNDENAMLLYFGYSPLKIIATNYWDANNHIFHTLLVRFMGVWFGEENSIAIRLPTLLFGLAGLWMVYRIALELFNSQLIARMALLIATVNPIHIHYSQTARGYSLIIFFSAAMILLSLRVLRSEISKTRGILITICGFLSVYTIPTNIFFLLGLGVWVIAVLFLPDPKDKFFKSREERREKGVFFLKIAVVISILCSVAYAPLLKQMVATIRNHQLMGVETQWNSISVLIPAVLERVFPDNLMLFLPLLIFGFFYKRVVIMVDRNNPESRKKVFRIAKERLKNGTSMAIFPEGLVPPENIVLAPFKKGAFSLAIEFEMPIVPQSYYDCKRLFSWDVFKGGPGIFRTHQHQFIETKGLKKEDIPDLKEQVFNIIETSLMSDREYMKDTNRLK